jgi:hypothetical protein
MLNYSWRVLILSSVFRLAPTVSSRSPVSFGGVRKHKLLFSNVPAKNTNHLCRCTLPPLIHFARSVQYDNSASRAFTLVFVVFCSCFIRDGAVKWSVDFVTGGERGRRKIRTEFGHSRLIVKFNDFLTIYSFGLMSKEFGTVLGGLVVSVLATGPKVREFKPGRGRF